MFRAPPPRQQQQVIQVPDPGDVGRLVVRSAQRFAVTHKYWTGFFFLGWLFLFLVGSGIPLTREQERKYGAIVNSINFEAEFDAADEYYRARQYYEYSLRGIWPFRSCDDLCQKQKRRMERSLAAWQNIKAESIARMRDAKRTAGVWSQVSIREIKDSFWSQFEGAKAFAKRQSAWDIFWMGLRSLRRDRDETWIQFGLKVLIHVLFNFSIGLLLALLFFVLGLWTIVQQYSDNPLVSAIFFVGCTAAAFSFVVTYLMAVYGAAAAGVYGLLKVAETSARAQLRDQQRGEQIRYGERLHYD